MGQPISDPSDWWDWVIRTGRPDGNPMPPAFRIFGRPSTAPKAGCRCHDWPEASLLCRKHRDSHPLAFRLRKVADRITLGWSRRTPPQPPTPSRPLGDDVDP